MSPNSPTCAAALCLLGALALSACGKPPVPLLASELKASSSAAGPGQTGPLSFSGSVRLSGELALQAGTVFVVVRQTGTGLLCLTRKYSSNDPAYGPLDGGERLLAFRLDERDAMMGGLPSLAEADVEALFDLDGSVDTKDDILARAKVRAQAGDEHILLRMP